MFILYAVLAGVLLGLVVGGRPAGLARLQVRWGWLIVLGLLVQVVLFTDAVAARVGDLGAPLYVASTVLVDVAILRNLRIPGMPLVLAGAASNLAAIVANGGWMPASPSALGALGKSIGDIYSNSAVVQDPALPLLTDIFAMPRWMPWANVFSVGDVFIGTGIALVIVIAMRDGSPRSRPVRAGNDPSEAPG